MFKLMTLMSGAFITISLLVMSLVDVPVFSKTVDPVPSPRRPPLVVLCAASNREVMEAVVENFMNQNDTRIELQFGPSQTLVAGLQVTGEGDLLLPADQSYLEQAEQSGLTGDAVYVASMNVCLAVKRGNPRSIYSLRDLECSDVRLVQANPDLAAIGRLTKTRLQQSSSWDRLERATDGFVSTVTEAANSVVAGAADVAIVYDTVVVRNPELEMVSIEEFEDLHADVSIAISTRCKDPQRAEQFINYLVDGSSGRSIYRIFGFTVPESYDSE